MQSSLLTLAVLEYVAEHQPVRVSEVASGLGRPKSTVQRALVTLRAAGWIRPDGSEWTRWVLTPRVLEVARGAANEQGLHDAAYPVLDELRRQERESGMLAVREGSDWVVVDFLEGQRALRVRVEIGLRRPLHAGAGGKSILANLADDEIESILSGELIAVAPDTITSAPKLRAELALIRERGFATSTGEVTPGITSLSAPVFDRDGTAIASISVTVPEARLAIGAPALAKRLVDGAALITAQLRPRRGAGAQSRRSV